MEEFNERFEILDDVGPIQLLLNRNDILDIGPIF